MEYNRGHSSPASAKSRSDEYYDTLRRKMPRLDGVFADLADGYTPNFLDMFGAISEMVAFYTKGDQPEQSADCQAENRSQNKCRFCS